MENPAVVPVPLNVMLPELAEPYVFVPCREIPGPFAELPVRVIAPPELETLAPEDEPIPEPAPKPLVPTSVTVPLPVLPTFPCSEMP